MIKYRFKTEEEFIKEFGKNWRYVINGGWSDKMDGFLGKPVEVLNKLEFKQNICVGGWTISRDMITKNDQTIKLIFKDNEITAIYGEYSATAKCSEKDEYNANFGIAIALSRLARKIGEYETEKLVKIQEKHNILDEI